MAEAIIRGNSVSMTGVITAAGAITAKTVAELNDCIGIYLATVSTGEDVAVALMCEVELDKESGVAFAVGDKLYWDATNDRLDKTNTNIPAGVATRAAASADVRASVQLVPGLAPT